MLEFEKVIEVYNRELAASKKGFREGWDGFHSAEQSYRRAASIREQLLQNILKEKGLVVCSDSHIDPYKPVKNPTAEQLGIYPREKTRLFFYKRGPYTVRGKDYDDTYTSLVLRRLCPEHFPQVQKWTILEEGGFSYIKSEIYEQDGKYIMAVNSADVTRQVKSIGRDMEVDGMWPFLIKPEVYRHFGIPDLPEKPNLDSVQHSR